MLTLDYRPESLTEVIGQRHIKKILTHMLETDDVPQTMLFYGPHGIGKTTVARIIAKNLGCTQPLEIDGATNRGIDKARELQNKTVYVPLEEKLVIIIDEFHMMTREAFNSLLKLLEEPPDYIYFVLVTTDTSKVPNTVLSRCYDFKFKPISDEDMSEALNELVLENGIKVPKDGIPLIVETSGGSMRDAIKKVQLLSHLDNGAVSREELLEILSIPEEEKVRNIFKVISEGNFHDILKVSEQTFKEGTNGVQLGYQILGMLKKKEMTPKRLAVYKRVCEVLLQHEYSNNDRLFMDYLLLQIQEVMNGGIT